MYKKILQLLKTNKREVMYALIAPVSVGILTALILSNQFTSTTVISPKRSSPEASSNGVGFLAALSGIEDEKLSPELRFATNYFYSYKFLSNFIIENDIIGEILMFKAFDKKSKKTILKNGSEKYLVEELFSEEDPLQGAAILNKATKEFRKYIKMYPSRSDPSLAVLEVTHYSPEFSFRMSKRLIKQLDKEIAALDIKSSDNQILYINSILSNYESIETSKILGSILNREFTKKILANSSDQYAFLVLDPPVYPINKSKPRRSVILLVSLLMGLFLSSLLVSYKFLVQENYIK
jgi:LPS O-antigen subunit length determinant protein (WzzB/FepE family)